jgi:hypothetical protein
MFYEIFKFFVCLTSVNYSSLSHQFSPNKTFLIALDINLPSIVKSRHHHFRTRDCANECFSRQSLHNETHNYVYYRILEHDFIEKGD